MPGGREALSGVVALALLGVAGCGGSQFSYPSTNLKGAVSVDGKPVEKGSITFSPLGQGQAVGGQIIDGRYEVKGVPLGEVLVTFNAMRETGRKVKGYSEPIPELENIIPPRYREGLKIQVSAGQEEQQFDFKSR